MARERLAQLPRHAFAPHRESRRGSRSKERSIIIGGCQMARSKRSSEKPKNVGNNRRGGTHWTADHLAAIEPTVELALFYREGAEAQALQQIENMLGKRTVVHSADYVDGALEIEQISKGTLVVLSQLGIVLTELPPGERLEALSVADSSLNQIVAMRGGSPLAVCDSHSRSVCQSVDPRLMSYVRGYRDATRNLSTVFGCDVLNTVRGTEPAQIPSEFRDSMHGTWGLHATGVLESRYSGRGIRVAALVDGLDANHPDWTARQVFLKSFVPGELVTDGGATGTHYLGTAVGISRPSEGPRYGCAPEAVPFVAKVLSKTGAGSRTSIFAALEWAVANQCSVILTPLGWSGAIPDNTFETLASRVLSRGALVVSGAGNSARRPNDLGFVSNPAACPSVVAVGSIDCRLELPLWTPRSLASSAGTIDLVGPGVNLISSVPRPRLYDAWSGSSTAAAFVAGIAALWAESLPSADPRAVRQALVSHARRLVQPISDVGAGLVHAP